MALAPELRRFLEDHVRSLEELELLVLLMGTPDEWWSAARAVGELGLPRVAVAQALESLASRNLLDVRLADAVLFRYGPVTPELDRLARSLAAVHQEHRVVVTAAVLKRGTDRIRAFADAFRIRKEPNDG
jgi:hypothetical protein